jgi:hypothetical protein
MTSFKKTVGRTITFIIGDLFLYLCGFHSYIGHESFSLKSILFRGVFFFILSAFFDSNLYISLKRKFQ